MGRDMQIVRLTLFTHLVSLSTPRVTAYCLPPQVTSSFREGTVASAKRSVAVPFQATPDVALVVELQTHENGTLESGDIDNSKRRRPFGWQPRWT
jgi:hypothetical protein